MTGEASAHVQHIRSSQGRTSLRQVYDMTYEYSLESLNFLAFMKPNKHKMRSKGLSQFAFRNMIVPFYTTSSARARSSSPPSPTQVFRRKKFLQNPPPSPNCYHQISLKRFWYLLPTCCVRAEIGRPRKRKKKCEQGKGFVKFCVKKACVGDGGELERALDDVFGI